MFTRKENLIKLAAQAYQVIGALSTIASEKNQKELERALDYFSDMQRGGKIDDNFLPFSIADEKDIKTENEEILKVIGFNKFEKVYKNTLKDEDYYVHPISSNNEVWVKKDKTICLTFLNNRVKVTYYFNKWHTDLYRDNYEDLSCANFELFERYFKCIARLAYGEYNCTFLYKVEHENNHNGQ